jgi:hypothetical protein
MEAALPLPSEDTVVLAHARLCYCILNSKYNQDSKTKSHTSKYPLAYNAVYPLSSTAVSSHSYCAWLLIWHARRCARSPATMIAARMRVPVRLRARMRVLPARA